MLVCRMVGSSEFDDSVLDLCLEVVGACSSLCSEAGEACPSAASPLGNPIMCHVGGVGVEVRFDSPVTEEGSDHEWGESKTVKVESTSSHEIVNDMFCYW